MSIHSHLYRATDPQTSARAAGRASAFVAGHELRILHAITAAEMAGALSGFTYREIAYVLNMEPVAVARRLKGMERKGVIRRNGERDGMTVWEAA